jgi:hypothetical protein
MSTAIEGNIFYKGNNSNPAYNNPKFIATIVSQTELKMGREMSASEIRFISNFVRKLDPDTLLRMPRHRVLNGITESIIKRFSAYDCTTEIIDTHEILKNQIGISGEANVVSSLIGTVPRKSKKAQRQEKVAESSGGISLVDVNKIFGFTQSYQLQKLLNPNALLRTNYVLMDTRYRVLDSNGDKFFSWNHSNNVSRVQGSINTVGTIRDIVALRVFPFKVPYISSLDTSYRKVSMLIREFQAQSFVGQEQRRFHFLFDPIVDGDSILLNPSDNNDGYYRFGQPITQFDTITIDFGSPLEEVLFDIDRSSGQATLYGDGIETHFTTQIEHKLITGHIIYISDFSSLNDQKTSTITNDINRNTGHNVIVVSPTVFKIRVDSNDMTPLIESGGVVQLNNDNVENLTIPINTTLNIGDRVRVTDAAVPPFTIDEVFNVKFYEPAVGKIHLDRDPGLGVVVGVFVFKDYRPPPLTATASIAAVEPVNEITITGAVATGGTSFLNDYKVGDFINFITVVPPVDDGPHTVVSIQSNSQLTTNRVAVTTITGMTALKATTLDQNVFTIYFGSKRIFVPLEITFITPE